jgi:hypothetical protein
VITIGAACLCSVIMSRVHTDDTEVMITMPVPARGRDALQ